MTAVRRFVQIAPGVAPGDAISNEMHLLAVAARTQGFAAEAEIFAERIGPGLDFRAEPVMRYAHRPGDCTVLHYGIAFDFADHAGVFKSPAALIYHNVTPARFFLPYNLAIAGKLERSRLQLRALRPMFDAAFADSSLNARELERAGFAAPGLLPVLFPDRQRRAKLRPVQEPPCVLFVGRVAPNKGLAHLLKIFACLRRMLPQARLKIAGDAPRGLVSYQAELTRLARALGLTGCVEFTGFLSEGELSAAYAGADLFLSASLHEGFCAPLLEAMECGIPVMAFAHENSAAEETMGGAGVLFRSLDYARVAALAAEILENAPLRAAIVAGQFARMARYNRSEFAANFFQSLERLCGATGK